MSDRDLGPVSNPINRRTNRSCIEPFACDANRDCLCKQSGQHDSARLPRMPLKTFALTEHPPGIRLSFENQITVQQVRRMFFPQDAANIVSIEEPRPGQGVVKVHFPDMNAAQAALTHRFEGMIRPNIQNDAIQRQADEALGEVREKVREIDAIITLMKTSADAAKAITDNLTVTSDTALHGAQPAADEQAVKGTPRNAAKHISKKLEAEYKRGVRNEASRLYKKHRAELEALRIAHEKEKAGLVRGYETMIGRFASPTPGVRVGVTPKRGPSNDELYVQSMEVLEDESHVPPLRRGRDSASGKSLAVKMSDSPQIAAHHADKPSCSFEPPISISTYKPVLSPKKRKLEIPVPETPQMWSHASISEELGLMTPMSPTTPRLSSPCMISDTSVNHLPMFEMLRQKRTVSNASQACARPIRRRSDRGWDGRTMRREVERSPTRIFKVPMSLDLPDSGTTKNTRSNLHLDAQASDSGHESETSDVIEVISANTRNLTNQSGRPRRRSAAKAKNLIDTIVREYGRYKGR